MRVDAVAVDAKNVHCRLQGSMKINPNVEFKRYNGIAELGVALATHVGDVLRRGIGVSGTASLIVSGGTTPVPFFEALSGISLPWEKVWVSLADERWVDVTNPESNENLVRRHLLKDRAESARFAGLKNAAVRAADGESECSLKIAEIPVPFDVVVLGMGSDGHTASLFPGAPELSDALSAAEGQPCRSVTRPGGPPERMTLTLPTLLHSRQIVVHITGERKRLAYERALATGPVEEMPIRAVLEQRAVPVTVWWAPEEDERSAQARVFGNGSP